MGSQIYRERVYGNFKRPKGERMKKKAGAASRRPGMSAAHLDLIRKLPCTHCLAVGKCEAHHLKAGTNERGMGLRSTDRWAVPLCHDCHMELEAMGSRNEAKWFDLVGVVPVELASALWYSTGDLPTMLRILLAARTMGRGHK